MVYVYCRPLPGYCREMVAPNEDGSYTIIINEALSDEQKVEAYYHAVGHIDRDDFSGCASATAIEAATHIPL